MAYGPNAAKIALAFQGGQLVDDGKPVRFAVVDIGPLVVTTGAIAASDPLVSPAPAPFPRAIPNGRYPVRLAVAAFENGDERVAFAEVRFAETPVVRWELAAKPKDSEPLGEHDFIGYGVDTGTGCFMDATAGRLLEARMDAEASYFETIIEAMEKTSRPTWSHASIRPAADREENVVCFSSGWGDGVYPSFFGVAENGTVAALLTDFMVLLDDLPREPTAAAAGTAAPAPRQRRWWHFWRR